MSESNIGLGSLLKFVVENKNIKSNLNIDRDCSIRADNPKPLIKILNYFINYLKQNSVDAIDITLKGQSGGCLLCFIISTDIQQLPPLSEKLDEALSALNAAMRIVFEKGKYVQILVYFCQGHVPKTVIVEV
jgi:hypothetical protein